MDWPGLVAQMDGSLVDTFGEPTTYTQATGQASPVSGIFDAAYVRADAGRAGVGTASPAVFYRLADVPIDPAEDEPVITIRGLTYEVAEVQPDGHGGVRLLLTRLP